jgi:hypothetical protein
MIGYTTADREFSATEPRFFLTDEVATDSAFSSLPSAFMTQWDNPGELHRLSKQAILVHTYYAEESVGRQNGYVPVTAGEVRRIYITISVVLI